MGTEMFTNNDKQRVIHFSWRMSSSETDSEAMRVFLLLPFASLSSEDKTQSGLGNRRPSPRLSPMRMCYVSSYKAFPFSASVLAIMGRIIPAHTISQAGSEARIHSKIQKETLNPSQIGTDSIQRFHQLLRLSFFLRFQVSTSSFFRRFFKG